MLDTALARGAGYTWSTGPFNLDDVEFKAFRSTLELPEPVQIGESCYCSPCSKRWASGSDGLG